MAPAYSRLRKPLSQFHLPLLLLVSVMLVGQVCHAKRPDVRCGKAIDDMLALVCRNGFNKMDLEGSLRRLRSRRNTEIFLSPQQFIEQIEKEHAKIIAKRGNRKPSLKKMLKMEASWRRKHQTKGKLGRVRRDDVRSEGVADECCSYGCAFSDMATYCRRLIESLS
ncbi:probable insulin-like peptide 4 [Ceratitis capitata]|uniref:(Mediterranean fruit fly) hypothetical protein n=1 Tax=Ceratitis capitata TaxID=7213 RepID=W8C7C9_CERCA|nr:probable insulin-like peptide 4 [Ceratitis capitata]CAD7003691.1 unnamed protein product [Ceratitis capitata]